MNPNHVHLRQLNVREEDLRRNADEGQWSVRYLKVND